MTLKFITEIYINKFHEHKKSTKKFIHCCKKNWEHVSKHYVQIMTNKSNRITKTAKFAYLHKNACLSHSSE